jgi:hypothetical protein
MLSIKNPAEPTVVGEIGPPDEGTIGQTSREPRCGRGLLVWNLSERKQWEYG